MNLEGKKVLVIGTGKSGIGAATLLSEKNACPILFDEKEDLNIEEVRARLPEGVRAEVIAGTLPEEMESAVELVVPSPGVPADAPVVKRFADRGIPVWGEVELAYAFEKGSVLAITGTNGKTTTTALTGRIMEEYFRDVFVVGNIGNPYTSAVSGTTANSVTVAEISSFQLETIERFHPEVSAILNITPDHLNRHHTMENYAAVKQSITANQTKEDFCVLNYEDEYTRAFGEKCPAKVIWFSSARELENGYYLKGDEIFLVEHGVSERLMNIHEMNLIGRHNVENVMAAIAMAAAFGVPLPQIVSTVKRFQAVEHRIEFVAEKQGVVYYNDSKGTNPDAAIKGIEAMSRPTILIGGGYDKQNEYDEWIEACKDKVKLFVLIGQTREKIADCIRAHGMENYLFADTFPEALALCTAKAEAGDAVLLSPACASWGMFPNYEVRGNEFKKYVNSLEE